jgi:hypothetical protein
MNLTPEYDDPYLQGAHHISGRWMPTGSILNVGEVELWKIFLKIIDHHETKAKYGFQACKMLLS